MTHHPEHKPFVQIESPYAAQTREQRNLHIFYAQRAMRDSLLRGEIPYASHLLYAQDNILDDDLPEERHLGIHAGFAWLQFAQYSVVYTDLGISPGMRQGIEQARQRELPIVYRTLKHWDATAATLTASSPHAS